jgi:hypothetical protein
MLASYRKPFLTWIALFAVLYAVATPLFAALRGQFPNEYFGALCTLGGVKEAPGDPAVPAQGGTGHELQCVFCLGGAWQPPLDVSLPAPVLPAPAAAVSAVRDQVVQSASAALQPLGPRAPPRFV